MTRTGKSLPSSIFGTSGPKQAVIDRIRNLSNANLIHILHQGYWNERLLEVMEYCRGGSLTSGMPYSAERLRELLPQIVPASTSATDRA